MFDRSSQSRHKNTVRVRIALAGGETLEGLLFLKIDERLIDMLNDPRGFIPLRGDDGATVAIAKAGIVSVAEIANPAAAASGGTFAGDDEEAVRRRRPDAEEAPERRPRPRRLDPYEVLRIERSASLEEIKRAYKARIKAVHPDSIAALELDEDLARAANLSTQKVNQAYDTIMRERQQAEEPRAAAAGES